MLVIRKKFDFNGAHIVRKCTSKRCSESFHSHTYEVEVFITSTGLDNGQMILDFGIMKNEMKDLIKSFDNTFTLWEKDDVDILDFLKSNQKRFILLPISPSAESFSILFFKLIDALIKGTHFFNGEKEIELKSVRVHETKTGYAEAFRGSENYLDFDIEDIYFSDEIINNWKNPKLFEKLKKSMDTGLKVFRNEED